MRQLIDKQRTTAIGTIGYLEVRGEVLLATFEATDCCHLRFAFSVPPDRKYEIISAYNSASKVAVAFTPIYNGKSDCGKTKWKIESLSFISVLDSEDD